MKKLLFATLMFICMQGASAQLNVGVQTDSARMAEYRELIGLDMTVPDFEVKKIDDAKMGTRLANLLRYFEENYSQDLIAVGLLLYSVSRMRNLNMFIPK